MSAKKVFLLFDYDGTLTPIVKTPQLATLSSGMRKKLKTVVRNPKFCLGVISGRSLTNLKRLIHLKNVYYSGNHGLEIEGPGLKLVYPQAAQSQKVIGEICRELEKALGGIKGIVIEDKGLSASVHYRMVGKNDVRKVMQAFKNAAQPYLEKKKIVVKGGKKVKEIRLPYKWDKGKAALWILKSAGGNFLPVYFGDDLTDEDAFRVLKKKGITVRVGKKSSSLAQFYVKGVGEVNKFLDLLGKN